MNLKRLIPVCVVAVLSVAGIVAATQATNDHNATYVAPGDSEKVVPIGTFVLPDGTVIFQEGAGEYEEVTPQPGQ